MVDLLLSLAALSIPACARGRAAGMDARLPGPTGDADLAGGMAVGACCRIAPCERATADGSPRSHDAALRSRRRGSLPHRAD